MTTEELIMYGVRVAQKERVPIDASCAHLSDKMIYKLIAYEDGGQTAVMQLDGTTRRFPASEVFDPNKARDVAVNTLATSN